MLAFEILTWSNICNVENYRKKRLYDVFVENSLYLDQLYNVLH